MRLRRKLQGVSPSWSDRDPFELFPDFATQPEDVAADRPFWPPLLRTYPGAVPGSCAGRLCDEITFVLETSLEIRNNTLTHLSGASDVDHA